MQYTSIDVYGCLKSTISDAQPNATNNANVSLNWKKKKKAIFPACNSTNPIHVNQRKIRYEQP